ncbi:hypothetical protein PHISCL_10831, partial [Aspergillus sclerotialis]
MAKRTIHVAVLECDTPVDAVHKCYGSYGDMFDRLLRQGMDSAWPSPAEFELVVSKWPVVDRQ